MGSSNREAEDGPTTNTAEVTRSTWRHHRRVPRCTARTVSLIGLASALLLGLALNRPSVLRTTSSLYANFWDSAAIVEPARRPLDANNRPPSYVTQLIHAIQQGQRPPKCPANESDYQFIRCKDLRPHPQFLSECKGLLNVMMKSKSNDIVTLLPLGDEHERHNDTLGETVVHPAERPHLLASIMTSKEAKNLRSGIDAINATRTAEPFVWMPEIYNINNPTVLVVHGGAYFELFSGRIQKCDSPGPGNMNLVFKFANCGEFPPTPFVHSNSSILSTIPSYTTAVFLSSPNDGFFHQMVEKLPQAVILHDFLAQHTDITIVLKGTFNNRVQQALLDPLQQLLGDTIKIDVIDYTEHPIVYADTIVVPEPTSCGRLQPAIARATRAVIRQRLAVVAPVQKKETNTTTVDKQQPYILVVRRRRSRSIANHEELLDALTQALPREVFFVYDEATTPPAGIPQWSLFANAKLILAPHGAALSNLLAAAPDAVVVEFLAHGTEFNLCFAFLSTGLGLQYHPLTMDLVDDDNTKKFTQYHVNVTRATSIIAGIVERMNQVQAAVVMND